MPINYTFYIGVAVFAMFFGYFFGLFEGRSQGYKKRKKEEEKERETALETQAAEPLPAPPTVEPPPAPPPPPPLPSLLRLSRDEAGHLRLDLDDQRVNTAALTSGQRKRLIELLTLMRPWLEVPKPPSAPAPTPQPASSPQAVSAPQPAPTPPAPAAAPSRKPATRPVVVGPVAPIEPPAEAPDSMVAQIDAILQASLIGTPLEDQGIKLRESPEGSVLVHVGSKIYQAVEDIPDEAIKTAIRAAIAAWERRFTPGL